MKILLAFLFIFSANASEDIKKYVDSKGEVVLAGKLLGEGMPLRLMVKEGKKSAEEIFLAGIAYDDLTKYAGTNVVVKGKLQEREKQFQLNAVQIRSATPQEIQSVILPKF